MARMSKQHFQMVASTLAKINPAQREAQISLWVSRLRETNPRFDEARFRAYVAQCVRTQHGSRRRTRVGLFGDLFGSFRRARRRARGQCSRCGALSGGHFKSCRRR